MTSSTLHILFLSTLLSDFIVVFSYKTAPPSCNFPPPPPQHGSWFCDFPPTTCHLECHPGYVPSHSTSSTCLLGAWTSSSTCVAALALITGRNSPAPYNTVEIYGPGVHEKLPDLPDDRMYHTLSLVDNSVVLCGGYYTATSCLTLTPSNQWVPHSSTTAPRTWHSATTVLGHLHLLGGVDEGSRSTTESIAAGEDSWTEGWRLEETTRYACTAKVEPEVVVVTGGYDHRKSTVWYNVTSGGAVRLQDLLAPRYNHGCAYVRDAETGFRGILAAGSSGGNYDTTEIYDIAKGVWEGTGYLTSGRYGTRMVVLGDDILAMGGSFSNTVDRFSWSTRNWTSAEEMMEKREYHAVAAVPPAVIGILSLL